MKLEKKIAKNEAISVRIKTERNYFSITAMMGNKERGDDKIQIAGGLYNVYASGCLHTEIAEHFPELERFIPLHLSSLDGTPMFAFSNAKHWAKEGNSKVLAQHLRISLEEAQAICSADTEAEAITMIASTIKKMEPVWKEQAQEFLLFIENHKKDETPSTC
jgi:hypothetical protein